MLATGLVLVATFRETIEERFDYTLGVYLSSLIGQIAQMEETTTPLNRPDLGEPRFMLPLSGWYWMAVDVTTGEVVQTSDSLAGDIIHTTLELNTTAPGILYKTYGVGPAGDPLRLLARRVALSDGRFYLIVMSAAASTITDDTASFSRRLVFYLCLFAVSLLIITYIQWRVSMRPLTKLGSELRAIQEGKARHVTTDLPAEIEFVARALNRLIDSNYATLERSRRHVGNLAHGLKTPISVLINDADKDNSALGKSVREQTESMQRQVRYYLERAHMAARDRVIGTVTDVVPTIERLHRTMARLGERRGVAIRLDAADDVRFAGEQQDLEEIVGNLVDNAVKWADKEVFLSVVILKPAEVNGMHANQFQIVIQDDGPGLSPVDGDAVIFRGHRLDQSKPGSGLGLSIVAELVELYGGHLILDRSPQGGLRAVTYLPKA